MPITGPLPTIKVPYVRIRADIGSLTINTTVPGALFSPPDRKQPLLSPSNQPIALYGVTVGLQWYEQSVFCPPQ